MMPFRSPMPYHQPSYARLLELASDVGLQLVPAAYEMPLTGAVSLSRASIIPGERDGPFFCLQVHAEDVDMSASDTDWEVTIDSGSRKLTEGRVFGYSLFRAMVEAGAKKELPAPIVVGRSDQLAFEVTAPAGATISANSALYVTGCHARGPGGEAPDGRAELLAELVRAEGEFYAAGMVVTDGAKDGFSASLAEYEWSRIFLTTNEAGTRTDLRLRIGAIDVFPQGITGAALLGGGAAYTSGLLLEQLIHQARAERVELRQAGSGTTVARVLMSGRRFER